MNILEQWETFKVYIRLKKQGNKTQSSMVGCETDTNIRKKIYSCDTFLIFLLNQKKKKKNCGTSEYLICFTFLLLI